MSDVSQRFDRLLHAMLTKPPDAGTPVKAAQMIYADVACWMNADYAEIIERRIHNDAPLFAGAQATEP